MKSQTLYKTDANLEELENVASEIVSIIGNDAIILLNGNLAAGKTTLVSYIARVLGEGVVTSPTFSLQQCYGAKMFHYDFYRVKFEEILSLGLLEEFEKSGLHFIEWVDISLKELLLDAGFNLFELNIEINDSKSRKYILKALHA